MATVRGRYWSTLATDLGAIARLRVLVFALLFSLSASAADVPQSFTLDGRLYSNAASTAPLVDSAITFKVQILDEDKICILYEETQSISTLASNGYFSVSIGSELGAPRRSAGDSSHSMPEVFQNTSAVSGKKVSDGTACTMPAVGGKRRYIRIAIKPSTMGNTERLLTPDLNLDSVPNAVVAERAESLQGLRASDVLQTNTTGTNVLTQANVESLFSSTTRFNALTALVNGTSGDYMRSNSPSGAQLPVITGAPTSPTQGAMWYDTSDHKLKYRTGLATTVTLGTGTGSVDSVSLAAPTEFSVAGSPVTASGTITLTWTNQTQNKVFASPDLATGAPSFRALVAGDIPALPWSKITSGTPTTLAGYGITDAVLNAGAAPSLQSGLDAGKPAAGTAGRLYVAYDTQKIYRDSGAVWTVMSHGAPAFSDLTGSIALSQLPVVDFTKGGTGLSAGGSANQVLGMNAAGTGAEYKTVTAGSGISVSHGVGTVTIATTGSAPTGSASGDLSGTYPGPTVAKIQNVAVNATAPATGQVLRYGGTEWVPANFSIGSLLTAAGAQQFSGSATCSSTQTLTWSSLTDTFTCSNISGLDAAVISTGTVASARLPASATAWTVSGSDVYRTSGNVGVGTATPAAKLDVDGDVKVGNSLAACSATVRGSLRYNTGSNVLEFCDGSNWQVLAATATAGCSGPNAFSFTNVTNAALGSVVTSNVITPAGCAAALGVSVSGGGSPQISVNGGPWVTSTVVNPGETVRARVYTSSNVSDVHSVVVTIGSTVGTTWTVTNKAGNTRIFATAGTYNGNLGGLSGADATCQASANAAGYGGIWRAILSDSISNARDRLLISYPVVRATDGATVAAVNLWGGSFTNPVNPGGGDVWTGGITDGSRGGLNWCNNWTVGTPAYGSERYGYSSGTDASWTQAYVSICSAVMRLYCIEQPDKGCAPGAYSFTTVTGATRSALVTSNTITPAGCASTSLVMVHGEGAPQVSINGGVWVTSGTMSAGDTIAVRQTTKAGYDQVSTARVDIGGTQTEWTVTTETAVGATKLFITTNTYNGNLGGLAGADGICQAEAVTRGYAGTWKAILSDSATNAKDRLTITYPVIRKVDGVVLAATNLWSGGLSANTGTLAVDTDIWSGTDSNGDKIGTNWCDNWTNGANGYGNERYGRGYFSNAGWINDYAVTCNGGLRLYCVSQ